MPRIALVSALAPALLAVGLLALKVVSGRRRGQELGNAHGPRFEILLQ